MNRSIVRQLLAPVLLFSLLIMTALSGVEIFRDNRRETAAVATTMHMIDSGVVPALADDLWIMDTEQIKSQLQGIARLPRVARVTVQGMAGLSSENPVPTPGRFITRRTPLRHAYRGLDVDLGVLEVTFVIPTAGALIIRQLIGGTGMVVIEVLLISMFILFIFQRLVTRHLRAMAAYVGTLDLKTATPPLALDRKSAPDLPPDELGQLVRSINDMRRNLQQSFRDLELEVARRKEVEDVLRESSDKYQELTELGLEAIFLIDNETGRLLEVNTAAMEMYGYRKEEFLALRNTDLSAEPEDTQRVTTTTPTGSVIVPLRYHRRKDGTVFPVEITGRFFNRGGRSVHVAAIRDITERVRNEKALLESRHLVENILMSSPNLIYIYDLVERRNVYANREALDFLGYTPEQILAFGSTLFANILHPDDAAGVALHHERCATLSKGETLDFEYRMKHTDGTWRWLRSRDVVFARDSSGKGTQILGAAEDVTDRKRAEEELLKSQKLESLAILAGGIAHDFNNILTGILGNISFARLLLETEPQRAVTRLVEAEQAALRARDLTQQLLTFSTGGAPVRTLKAVGPLIAEATRFAAHGSTVAMHLEIAPDLWPAEVDAGQINQVLNNLVINAVQAQPTGGSITVRAENVVLGAGEIAQLNPGLYLRISIRDKGIGIPPHLQARIFDPFFTTKQYGSGLGLATVYSILHNHQGLITVDSRPGAGAVFTFYLPATPGQPVAQTTEPETLEQRFDARILVMDDESLILDLASEVLTTLGCRVQCASDGREMLEKYEAARTAGEPFDLVVMDLTIPGGLGGKEAIVKLLALDPDARAVVSSGYSSDPIMADYARYGFQGVLAKPYHINEICAVLSAILKPRAD